MRLLKALLLLQVILAPAIAQTTLSGNIGGITLEKSGNPFMVTDNVTIPAGKKVIIQEGCVFLFKPFTGIIVEGTLVVEGTLQDPVVFTTENDSKYNPDAKQFPNPFDWNGILIRAQAESVRLSNFVLEYSVYGVKSQKEEFLINNGTFSRNGQFHLTVGDKIKNVVEDVPYNFGDQSVNGLQTTTVRNHKDSPTSKSTEGSWRKPVGISVGVIGLGALGAGGYFFYKMTDYGSQYTKARTQAEMDDAYARRGSSLTAGVASAAAGGVLAATGIAILVWDHRSAQAREVSITPIIGERTGIVVGCSF
jgi:hypothetical protein